MNYWHVYTSKVYSMSSSKIKLFLRRIQHNILKIVYCIVSPAADLSDCLLSVGHLVRQTAAPSSLRFLFHWRSRTCFAGSETKSSETRQITVIHTINRKTCKGEWPNGCPWEHTSWTRLSIDHARPQQTTTTKTRLPNRFCPRWIVKGWLRDGIVSPAGGLGLATIYVTKRRPPNWAPTGQVYHHVGANNSYI